MSDDDDLPTLLAIAASLSPVMRDRYAQFACYTWVSVDGCEFVVSLGRVVKDEPRGTCFSKPDYPRP